MSGYLRFEKTGDAKIDAIIDVLREAGHAYHHTEFWHEPVDWLDGKSYHDLIQAVLNAAAEQPREREA